MSEAGPEHQAGATSHVVVADVKKNYNQVGTTLIEQLYGRDFLSLSGQESTRILAADLDIGAGTRVLDVGCGVGGPALHLVGETGCRLTGVDLVEWHVEEATRRADERNLDDRADFVVGDATCLEFETGSFDVVWSQDAWCHVPDKPRVVREVGRVVHDRGAVALTDWVQTGPFEGEALAEVCEAVASPNFATPEDYERWFAAEGFTVTRHDDISDHFRARYVEMMEELEQQRTEVEEQFSARVYDVMVAKNGRILQAFDDGVLGGNRLVAVRS